MVWMDDLAELQLRLEVAFFLEVRLRYIGRQWRDLSQAKVASRLWRDKEGLSCW